MKVAIFSTKYYEREYLRKFNTGNKHQLTFFEAVLNEDSTNLAIGFDAVCILLSDIISEKVIDRLSALGIQLICLRSAGFDNVDWQPQQKEI